MVTHRKPIFRFLLITAFLSCFTGRAQDLQPYFFSIERLLETLNYLGCPLSAHDGTAIQNAIRQNETNSIQKINSSLEKYTLFEVHINPESRVKVNPGAAKPQLIQGGWQTFLVKVHNEAGITSGLDVFSPQSQRVYDGGEKLYGMGNGHKGSTVSLKDIADRWLDISLYTTAPMKKTLSGIAVEYFIIQLYSRDAGKRAARMYFNTGQATQDLGFRNATDILFDCLPSRKVKLDIVDENGNPTTASLIIKDKYGRVYPSQAKRLAPDFFFQPQIYRSSGELLELPPGEYTVEYGRGPEYLTRVKNVTINNRDEQTLVMKLERWVDPSAWGWYSGDHHIHAAGCSHYTSPTEGVDPTVMMRHISGEAVNVGSVLTWGPGYDHQKQFFEGKENPLSTKNTILRYDLEISGFPSSHAGHLVLLRLANQYYPNTKTLEDWPSWTIPVLQWARHQNAITGYAHSGLGLAVMNNSLPNYEMPRFDGIGANEFIVAVTQDLVDFISTMDTPPTWELNIWYHILNCGFRTRISGETDFPCMSDFKVAHGRSYVKIDGNLDYDKWTEGLKLGRSYVSEGKSHIIDFNVDNVEVGTSNSEVHLTGRKEVTVQAKVIARIEPEQISLGQLELNEKIWEQRPFWSIDRARIANSHKVPLELIVNGEVVDAQEILANGTPQDITFKYSVEKSSWIALRILPSAHSNPIFVMVNNQPIRASKKSAQWCLEAVDVCWEQKVNGISDKERADARKSYDSAKEIYRRIILESEQ